MSVIAFLASLFALGSCVQLKYHDCGSTASLQSVTLTPCTSQPCHIHVNHTYTGQITFTPSKDASLATNNVTGIYITSVSSTEARFGEYEKNACKQSLNCPLVKGRQETFSPAVTAPATMYTDQRIIGRWELRDEHHETIICFEFPVITAS